MITPEQYAALVSQLATLMNVADELGRDLRIGLDRADKVQTEFHNAEHTLRNLRTAIRLFENEIDGLNPLPPRPPPVDGTPTPGG